MSFLVTETPEGLSLRSEIAGPGSRALASLIDLVLFLALLYVTVIVCAFIPDVGSALLTWIAMGFGLALMFFQAACALVLRGVTPGKWALGLVVVDEYGFPATLLQHLVRGIFWPLEMLPFPLPIGIMCMAGSAQHQRLGDRAAGTLVLRLPPKVLPPDPYLKVEWTRLQHRRLELAPAHGARFDEHDFLFLRNLIGRRDVRPARYGQLLQRALKHYLLRLNMTLPQQPTLKEARAILSELYVFLRHMRSR